MTALAAVASVREPYVALPCCICRCCLPDRMRQRSRARNERRSAGHRCRRGRRRRAGRVGRRRRCRRRGHCRLRHRVAERARRRAGRCGTGLNGADRRLVVMQPGLIIQKQDRGEDAPKHQTDIRHGSVSCPARGRSRLARMDDSVAGGASRARNRARHHNARSRYAHSKSSWDRSGSWASASD